MSSISRLVLPGRNATRDSGRSVGAGRSLVLRAGKDARQQNYERDVEKWCGLE